MAQINSIRVENVDSLLRKLGEMEDVDLFKALTQACLKVEREAKKRCPVDTGILRASITHQVKGDIGIVGTNIKYAPYVEYGTGIYAANGDGRQDVPWFYKDAEGKGHMTSGQEPQPFLNPALDNNRQAINDIFINYLSKEVRRIAK